MSKRVSTKAIQRKPAKETKRVNFYHHGGYESRKMYTNDRYVPLTGEHRPYGLEIELMCSWYDVAHGSDAGLRAFGAFCQNTVFAEFPEDLFKYEQDCTISGPECITQCMSREFIRNHYPEFKNLFDEYLPRFGMLPDNHCGMHVNIGLGNFGSNPAKRLDCTRKLFYFINKYYDLSLALFRRDRNVTRWCGRMPYENARNLRPEDWDNDHGQCFNLGHYHEGDASRIELRIVGGQRTYGAFRNTMETVFHLVSAVKTLTWEDMDNLTAVFAGCNKYVLSRLKLAQEEGRLDMRTYLAIDAISDKDTEYL